MVGVKILWSGFASRVVFGLWGACGVGEWSCEPFPCDLNEDNGESGVVVVGKRKRGGNRLKIRLCVLSLV